MTDTEARMNAAIDAFNAALGNSPVSAVIVLTDGVKVAVTHFHGVNSPAHAQHLIEQIRRRLERR